MTTKRFTYLKRFLGDAASRITGAAIDSRKIKEGDLFFALPGEKVDGHNHLQEAAANKASAAVVSKNYSGDSFGLELIKVEDVVAFLQTLACEAAANKSAKVVAVTGSVGKTTTKEFVAHLLEAKYRVWKTLGNANSQVGLPLAILNSDLEGDIFVVEMGMSVRHEIERLVKIIPPDVAIISKIGLAHAEFFPDGLEGIAAAKAEIFSHPKTKVGIVNTKAKQFKAIAELQSCQVIYFGEGEEFSFDCIKDIKLPFKASHLCENFLAAAVCARHFEVSWEDIASQAKTLPGVKMRFEMIERDGILIISDAYNANPESMCAAIRNLPSVTGKKIAVFGEMKELGKFSESSHREIAEFALGYIDHFLCFGKGCLPMLDVFAQAGKPAEYFSHLTELREKLFALAEPGDLVLLKGSNANNLWKILE